MAALPRGGCTAGVWMPVEDGYGSGIWGSQCRGLRKAQASKRPYAGDPALVGPEPEAAPIEEMGFGWINAHGTGHGY